MAGQTTALDQLKSFLNELFQFESQDLDFGVYKILHYKKKEIANFIDHLLVDKVNAQLETLSEDEARLVQKQIEELENSKTLQKWLEAVESKDETRLEIYEEDYKDEINRYKALKTKATESSVSVETENQIYNHLTLFFSRYYDKGDFISKRRFGKNEKYVVPYNGEETHFYWANHDQYYVKSSETFQQYAFKVAKSSGTMVVKFKLYEAQLEQGNVKEDEPNLFILSEKEAEIGDEEATFFFEYRPLTTDEKNTIKGNRKQEALNEAAFEKLKQKNDKVFDLAKLWKPDQDGNPLLLKKLNHYTRKNSYDFFIHKNLKGFLQRELDFYIKSELVGVDDLYLTDTDTHFERLKHNLKKIKVFKAIADTIIDFVNQIEDFQKKLWEKKKFVLSTEWVITIDRLVKYLNGDESLYGPILDEVIGNKLQVDEWVELFGKENIPKGKLSLGSLKANLHDWRKLPIDTLYFDLDFKWNLAHILSKQIDLENSADGLIIHSDNFQGINQITEKFSKKIKCCYIDPPYNGKSSEIIYKNTYKHSSWAALMQNRIQASKDLLREDSVKIIAIDENEQELLGFLIKREFGDKKITCIPIVINPGGTQDKNFAYTHDYAYFIYLPDGEQIGLENREDNPDIRNFMNTAKGNTKNYLRESGPNCFYPIIVDGEKILGFGDVCKSDFVPHSPNVIKGNIIEIYPIDQDGVQRKWVFARNTVDTIKGDLRLKKSTNSGLWEIHRVKSWLNYKTVWTDKKYSAKTYGTSYLKDIIGQEDIKKFSFPKSIYTVRDSIDAALRNEKTGVVLDYFAGSGTTFNAIQILNNDEGDRKCILVEQGDYIYTVIIPRVKKIAYTFDWKDGKPKDGSMNGLGVFFKYQRLEQYEETLENIAFNAKEGAVQKALELDTYIPKYFLEFETKGSQTLVNTEVMKDPWDYRLKVWDGFTYDTEQVVDLVETFNYLIGLHMQKCITKEFNGHKYQFIYGNNNANKQILVVWRKVKDWKLEDYQNDSRILKKELENFKYDLLYINDQAHIEDYQPIEEVFKNRMVS
jgi:adenine-specific DNA-methyltransferase